MATDLITGIRLDGIRYKENQRYSSKSAGPLGAIISKANDYVTGLEYGGGTSLTPKGVAFEAMDDRMVIDSRWTLTQQIPPSFGLPIPEISGTFKIRIVALGNAKTSKSPATATDYTGISSYAIGINFDATIDALDTSLLLTYSNKKVSVGKYKLSDLQALPVADLLRAGKVTGATFSGILGSYLAGAIDPSTPVVDLSKSTFAPQFSENWANTNWVA